MELSPFYYNRGGQLHVRTLYNNLLEQGKDEVTYFFVGDIFCIHLGTKYADFLEKIFAEISGKKFQTLGIT